MRGVVRVREMLPPPPESPYGATAGQPWSSPSPLIGAVVGPRGGHHIVLACNDNTDSSRLPGPARVHMSPNHRHDSKFGRRRLHCIVSCLVFSNPGESAPGAASRGAHPVKQLCSGPRRSIIEPRLRGPGTMQVDRAADRARELVPPSPCCKRPLSPCHPGPRTAVSAPGMPGMREAAAGSVHPCEE